MSTPELHTHRTLSTSIITTLRTRRATFLGREYTVVPVVCLVGDVVVHPMNSKGGEFVPLSVLSAAPHQWNGRPVLLDHPHSGLASANDPSTLEANSFGHIFNARVSNGKLLAEAWMDRERAKEIGPDAETIISRCESGENVDLSIGAFVRALNQPGIHNGVPYQSKWESLISDHLALLRPTQKGACSIEMGCGTNRSLSQGGQSMNPGFFSKILAAISPVMAEMDQEMAPATPATPAVPATPATPTACSCGKHAATPDSAALTADKETRDKLLSALTGKTAFTPEKLAAFSTEDLTSLAKTAKVSIEALSTPVDHTPKGRSLASKDNLNGYTIALAKRAGGQ